MNFIYFPQEHNVPIVTLCMLKTPSYHYHYHHMAIQKRKIIGPLPYSLTAFHAELKKHAYSVQIFFVPLLNSNYLIITTIDIMI
jgi:hypothetical protein